jgi:predicted aminopeptidase
MRVSGFEPRQIKRRQRPTRWLDGELWQRGSTQKPERGYLETLLLLGCFCIALGCGAPPSYLFQAAGGQLDLYRRARPIPEAISDTRTPEAIRKLLREVPKVKAFAIANGLKVNSNYDDYVALNRPYVVWFVNASDPLGFYPLAFWFPVVGTFPGLGWFDESEARQHAAELARGGWDVSVRGVRAFSTGGWFSDPIVSSMFTDSENAFGYLVNVILHESLHATTLVADQQFYNESLASFVGDQLTLRYLAQRFGEASEEMRIYRERELLNGQAEQLVSDRYDELEALYASNKSIYEKLMRKQQIMRELFVRVGFEDLPTNATLLGTRLYDVGQAEFKDLLERCGHDWERFILVTGSVTRRQFGVPQEEDFTPIVRQMAARGCKPFAPPKSTRYRLGR